MSATFRGALAALAALALAGCSATGAQSPTEAPTASVSAGPGEAAAAVARNKTELLAVIGRFSDQGCAYGRSGTTCSTDRLALGRLADAMQKDLETAGPWPAEIAKLADTTSSRLAAVTMLAGDESQPGSMLDTELVLLRKDLQSWSAYGG